MIKINEGQAKNTDLPGVKRQAFQVTQEDVGKTQRNYLGQVPYTFEADDVGRLVEVITGFTHGFMSWGFGSSFKELRQQYPENKPYMGAPSAKD